MKTLPLQTYIDTGYSQNIKYAVFSAQFGDGYKQTAANGINNKSVKWNVTYKNLNETNFTTLMNFIDELKGAEPFYATPRGSTQQTWCLYDNEIQVTETAVSELDGSVYRTVTFTVEKV